MDAEQGIGLVSTAFGLTKIQQRKLLQIGWVVLVSLHIAWACGWLSFIGLAGLVKADDFRELQQTANTSARITISKEIREQSMIRCRVDDLAVKESLTRYIEGLQTEYERIAKSRVSEPACPRGAP